MWNSQFVPQCPTCSNEFDHKDSLKCHISDGCKGSNPQQTACHRCGKEFQTNWHLERHSKTCLHSKEKIEKHLADHVCNPIQVRAPVGRSRQRALNVEENWIMDIEYPQNIQALVGFTLTLDYDWDCNIHMDIDRFQDSQANLCYKWV